MYRLSLPFILSLTIIIICSCHSNEDSTEMPSPVQKKISKKKKDRPDLALEQELLMTVDPKLERTVQENLLEIHYDLKKGRYASAQRNNDDNPWIERGPNNVGGRTRAIQVDLSNPTGNSVWAGSVSGGLWKSSNFQSSEPSWEPIDDFLPSIAISALAQDPSNTEILYFGTGEGWFNSDAVRGLGIWKSIDHGVTWEQLSSTNNSKFHHVQKIRIDENGVLYASTRADGLQKSTNGGQTWTKILGGGIGGGFSDRAADIEIASNGDIYATFGIFSSDGIYKSIDQGDSWISLIDGTLDNGLPTTDFDRIEIAIAPTNPLMVYALFESSETSECMGIYQTLDGGISWESKTVPPAFEMDNFASSQAWYDLSIGVDLVNPYVVYIGGVDLLRSLDGGETWGQISQWYGGGGFQYVHADQHDIVFFPGDRFRGIVVNDGGVSSFKIDPIFVENSSSAYCIPVHFECCSDYITNVRLGEIDNDSSVPTDISVNGYSNFTALSTMMEVNASYDLSITPNFTWDDSKIGAWIDFNQNGIFEENENILSESGVGPYTASFEVPSGASHGTTRLRIRLQFSPDYTPDPCDGAYTMGETEDYSVFIENCILGLSCNDGDPCTEFDELDGNCNCAGVLIDKDEDGNCDLINPPVFSTSVKNYNVTQFYSCDIHPEANSNIMIAGSQDNGTQYFQNEGVNSTIEVAGGDGGFCFIDQNEPNIQIATYIYNSIYITNDGWSSLQENVEIGDSKGRFINPMDYDSETNTLYGAYAEGFISRVKNVGTTNSYDTIAIDGLEDYIASTIKVDPNVPNAIWIATPKQFQTALGGDASKLIQILDANSENPTVGKTIVIKDEFSGTAYLSSMDIVTGNADHMAVSFSNYGVPSIWVTKDGGDSWTDVEGNLPDMPARWIMFDPFNADRAIIATEMGVWRSNSLEGPNTAWETMSEGLANVKCTMLKYRTSDNTLLVATYGRGLYTKIYCSSSIDYNEVVCQGESFDFFDESYSETGTYSVSKADESSCSGFISHILNLVVEDTMVVEEMKEICFASSTIFEGVEYSETGTYAIVKEDDNVCGTAKVNFTLLVRDALTVELGDTIYLNVGDDYTIQPDKSFVSYLWSDGSTNSSLTINGQDLGVGEHLFEIEVNDDIGCIARDSIIIVVLGSSSADDIDVFDYEVYPNPTSEMLYVEYQEYSNVEVHVFDIQGIKQSVTKRDEGGRLAFDVSQMIPGTYFILLRNEDGEKNQKFIKL